MKKWKCVIKDCKATCYISWFDFLYKSTQPIIYKWVKVGWFSWKCPQHNLTRWTRLSETAIKYLRYKSLETIKKPLYLSRLLNDDFQKRMTIKANS